MKLYFIQIILLGGKYKEVKLTYISQLEKNLIVFYLLLLSAIKRKLVKVNDSPANFIWACSCTLNGPL